MFDCLDGFKPTGTEKECYEQYLKHIIAVNCIEERISIRQVICVKVDYQRTNRHGTRVFMVRLDSAYFGTIYLSSKNKVRFETELCDKFYREVKEKITNAYSVERLLRICKEGPNK